MKRILTIAAVLISMVTAAQVHKDETTGVSYINVTPVVLPGFLVGSTGVATATRLYVELVRDDLYGEARFVYQVKGREVADTTKFKVITEGKFVMSDTVYANWNANHNDVPFSLLAAQLNLEME